MPRNGKQVPKCHAIKDTGEECTKRAKNGSKYCGHHRNWDTRAPPKPKISCAATVALGHRCTRSPAPGSVLCTQHLKKQQKDNGSQKQGKEKTSWLSSLLCFRASSATLDGPAQNTRSKTRLTKQEEQHLGAEVLKRCKDAQPDTLRSLLRVIYEGPSQDDSTAKQGWIYMFKLQQGPPNQFKVGSHHGKDGRDRVAEWERQCGYKAKVVGAWHAKFARAAESLINKELQGRDMWMGFLKECEKCGARHREWYKGEEVKIRAVIKHWVDYVDANTWLIQDTAQVRAYKRTILID